MALDHRIKKAREHFSIVNAADWAAIRPEWILKVPGCGPETLNHIRLYLTPHGITLQDDATVEFWGRTLGKARIGGQIADEDTLSIQPFTILVDTREQQPWTFTGMNVAGEMTITPYRFQSLGNGHGDYSVIGCEDEIHIERKSIDDAIGTFLAHGSRRDQWLETLQFLASIHSGSVAIEGSIGAVMGAIESRGRRSQSTLRRTFFNQVHAWQQDFGITFNFYDARRLAEKGTFYLLRRYWTQKHELKSRNVSGDSVDDVIGSL